MAFGASRLPQGVAKKMFEDMAEMLYNETAKRLQVLLDEHDRKHKEQFAKS